MQLIQRRAAALALGLGVLGAACGARSKIDAQDAAASDAAPSCATDADCDSGDRCAPLRCVDGSCQSTPGPNCDDGDVCTSDRCDPESGACLHEPVTPDADGDGYRAPRPGFAPGAPLACGDDCDDRSAAAHPLGVEVCDGVDNDCNGTVDDGASWVVASAPVRLSSDAFARASVSGLASDGARYAVTYSGQQVRWGGYFQALARDGSALVGETPVTSLASDAHAGTLLYNGSYFGTGFQDARYGNYEIGFNGLNGSGGKLRADLRVSNARGFSLDPSLAWNDSEFLLVWDDHRFETPSSDDVRLFGQRVSVAGELVGQNVELTPAGVHAEAPAIAVGTAKLGIVFESLENSIESHGLFFTTNPDLSGPSSAVEFASSQVWQPQIVVAGGRFVVTWSRLDVLPGDAIWGAVLSEDGAVLVPGHPITQGASFARSHAVLSLGDRLLLVWADDHDGNFQLYAKTLDLDLHNGPERQRITMSSVDALAPILSFGPNGDVGIAYEQGNGPDHQVFFARLACVQALGGP